MKLSIIKYPPPPPPMAPVGIPTVDFDLLVNGSPDQRSQMVRELAMACEDWGFFMVVNHGVSENLRDAMMSAMKDLFDLTPEEKDEYMGGHVLDPVRIGTSFNAKVDDDKFLRQYAKIFVHPHYHYPPNPKIFREVAKEYSARARDLGLELLKGIWESLDLEEKSIHEALDLNSCFQILIGNLYPPCPNPDKFFGLPAHSDHGLLTLLYQNGVDGLQVKRNGNWVTVRPVPNSFLVNTGDHMEIVTNGKYKSVLHRAILNNRISRMSIVTVVGPSLDTIVEPFAELVNSDFPSNFRGLKYRDYLEYQQSNSLAEKSALNRLRL